MGNGKLENGRAGLAFELAGGKCGWLCWWYGNLHRGIFRGCTETYVGVQCRR